jgi:pilus assembly protein CpaE
MRTLVAGLSESSAHELLASSVRIVTELQILQSWRHLEAAVEREQPDVMVVYVGADPRSVLHRISAIKQWYPRVHVVAVADHSGHGLTTAIDEVGCSDIVLLDRGPADMKRSLESLASRHGGTASGQAIAFLGGKGGVGTTMMALNTAASLAQQGSSVVVVDLHLYLGDVAMLMGVEAMPSLHWFVSRPPSFDPMMYAMSAPRHATGVSVIGLPGDLAKADPVTAEAAIRLVDDLRYAFDIAIIDCGSMLNEETLAVMSAVDRRLVVTSEQRASLEGAHRRVQALEPLGLHPSKTGLIVNRAHADSRLDWGAIENAIGARVFGRVRNAWKAVQGAQEQKKLLTEVCPQEGVTADVAAVATALLPRRRAQKEAFGERILRLFA